MSMSIFHPGRPDEAVVADIVFVHGLRGDLIRTWSHKGVCWPRDLLKHDLANVRIMSWAYDARIASWKGPAGQGSVFGNAETLLSDLSNERLSSTESSRPIVFVGHSLGGIVIKEALIRSAQLLMHKEIPELGMIYRYTAGVVFMGTPHRGTDKVQLADMLVLAAKVTWRKPNDELLNALRSNAGVLNQQRANFTTIMDGFSVVCLYESQPTTIGMIVPEDSACFDGRNIRRDMLPGDHEGMCKFPDRDATGYKRSLGHIKRLVAAAAGDLSAAGGMSACSRSESGDSTLVSPLRRGLFIEAAPRDSLRGLSPARRYGIANSFCSRCPADDELSSGLNFSHLPVHILPATTRNFFERSDDMDALQACLERQRDAVSSQPRICIINGMGGVGKSSLARAYAEEHRNDFDIICWVPSHTQQSVSLRYRDLGRRLRILGHETPVTTQQEEEVVDLVAEWLSNCDFSWLLVFDNIDDPELLSRNIPRSKRSQRGAVLCTTQNSHLLAANDDDDDQEGKLVTLLPFDPERGALFLMHRLKIVSSPLHPDTQMTAAAEATSKLLGGIPIFLAAVADFLSDSGWTFTDFVEQYGDGDGGGISSYPWSRTSSESAGLVGDPLQYPHPYPQDETHVFDHALQKLSPRAREAISILAWFDGAEIAESLVFSQHKDHVLDFLRPRPLFSMEPSIHILSRELQKHNLVRRTMSSNGRLSILTINTMVQQVIRRSMWQDPDGKELMRTAYERAYKILRGATPAGSKYQEPMLESDPRPRPTNALRLDRHIKHLGAMAAKCNIIITISGPDRALASLVYDAGVLICQRQTQTQTDLEEGIRLFNQALKLLPSNPVGDAQDHLLLRSHIYLTAGRTYNTMMSSPHHHHFRTKAAKLSKSALALRRKVYDSLGPYDRSLSHTIWLFCAKVDVAQASLREGAIDAARGLFEDCQTDYGAWCQEQEMPFDSAKVHHGLAECHLARGDLVSALQCARGGRAAVERGVVGDGAYCHLFPHACLLLRLGERDEALALHERVLEAQVKYFGEQALPTLESRKAVAALRDGL